jgi:protein-S-isoprenylcysteine O-methyltransferase Ste14
MMSLRERLIAFFHKGATSSSKIRTLLGTVFFFIYLSLFIVASLLVDNFLEFPKLLPTPLNIVLSMPFLATGLILNLWATLHFIKARGTPVRFNPPPKLVTTGPYAYVRHPQATSWFILFWGLGFLFSSTSLVFIFTPLFVLISVLDVKMIEESELEKRFGNEYVKYKKRAPMFIPRLKVRTEKRLTK